MPQWSEEPDAAQTSYPEMTLHREPVLFEVHETRQGTPPHTALRESQKALRGILRRALCECSQAVPREPWKSASLNPRGLSSFRSVSPAVCPASLGSRFASE